MLKKKKRGRGSFIKVFAVSPKRNDTHLLSHDGSLTSKCLVNICGMNVGMKL